MSLEMSEWVYKGTVTVNGRVFDRNYTASTMAFSEKKALNNLKYRFRNDNNLTPANNIQFLGHISRI